MDINTVIVLMWVAGFLLGSGLTLASTPGIKTKGKIASMVLTLVAAGLIISMTLVGRT